MRSTEEIPIREASGQKDQHAGRAPERSEEVSGDETKGVTRISTQKTVQPEFADPPVSVPIASHPISRLAPGKPLVIPLTAAEQPKAPRGVLELLNEGSDRL